MSARTAWQARATSLSVLLALSFTTRLPAQGYTQSGTVWGGLAGAAAGAVIGDNNDEAGAGALIGGAIGLLAGSALGNAKDQQIQSHRNFHMQQRYQAVSRAVGVGDVIAMAQSRVSDDVIISSIQTGGIQRPLDVSDIIQLHERGVSEVVIRAMQRAPVVGSAPYVGAPIYVQEHHCVSPAPVYYARPTYGHHYHRPYYYGSP